MAESHQRFVKQQRSLLDGRAVRAAQMEWTGDLKSADGLISLIHAQTVASMEVILGLEGRIKRHVKPGRVKLECRPKSLARWSFSRRQ